MPTMIIPPSTPGAGVTAAELGAETGVSKVAVIHSPAGTARNIFVDEESTPSTGEFAGDVRIVVADGSL